MYIVIVEYDTRVNSTYATDEFLKRVARSGRNYTGSGTAVRDGVRDLSWGFKGRQAAERTCSRLARATHRLEGRVSVSLIRN